MLVPLSMDHLAGWHRLWSDDKVRWWAAPQGSVEDSEKTLRKMLAEARETAAGLGWWAVLETASGHMVGDVFLGPLAEANHRIEIGYHIESKAWGRGYATEAARAALGYAYNTLCLDEIVAAIHIDNAASEAVARKLGLTRGAEFVHAGMPHHLWHKVRVRNPTNR